MDNTENDTLQRFLIGDSNQVRGKIVRLNKTYQAVAERYPYPLPVQQLLGEALATVALLSANIKFEGSLILQIESKGPINLLVAQSDHQLRLRGLARWTGEVSTNNNTIDEGQLALTIIPNQGERYQGIVALTNKNLAAAIETYFQQSEQLPTFLYLCSDARAVAGLFLQSIPDEIVITQHNYWEHITHLARTITSQELLELGNQQILSRLFNEEDIRLFEATPVNFYCRCNRERMEDAVRLMGHEDAIDLLKTHKKIVVTCEFCNHYYEFDTNDVANIFNPNGGA